MSSDSIDTKRAMPSSSPFTRAVVASMRRLYPEALADASWDNTGLLLEAPAPVPSTSTSSSPDKKGQGQRNAVLLAVDLTRAVADEAIARRVAVVVAYHPIIFRPLKSLTLADTQQATLLRLAAAGISVYSPHTAIDAAPGGLGDWLADIVTGRFVRDDGKAEESGDGEAREASDRTQPPPARRRPAAGRTYSSPTYPSAGRPAAAAAAAAAGGGDDSGKQSGGGGGGGDAGGVRHTREPLKPIASPPPGFEGAGMGRLVRFAEAQPLGALVQRIAAGVGWPKGFAVAVPQQPAPPEQSTESGGSGGDGGNVPEQNQKAGDRPIRTVAVCPGAGSGLFRDLDADLFFTGELPHHDALALTERGACVVSLFHSNSERGFLPAVLAPQLRAALLADSDNYDNFGGDGGDGSGGDVAVEVSRADRDPYGIVILQED